MKWKKYKEIVEYTIGYLEGAVESYQLGYNTNPESLLEDIKDQLNRIEQGNTNVDKEISFREI